MPQGLTLGSLGLRPEVAAAGLPPVQGVDAHELGQLEEVQQSAGLLQGLVELVGLARDAGVAPELLLEGPDLLDGVTQTGITPLHAAVLPHDAPQGHVEVVHAAGPTQRHEAGDALLDGALASTISGAFGSTLPRRSMSAR